MFWVGSDYFPKAFQGIVLLCRSPAVSLSGELTSDWRILVEFHFSSLLSGSKLLKILKAQLHIERVIIISWAVMENDKVIRWLEDKMNLFKQGVQPCHKRTQKILASFFHLALISDSRSILPLAQLISIY